MRTEHSLRELPQSYVLIADIDLQKNKKAFLIVNGIALLIIAIMVIPMLFIVPISTLFSFEYGLGRYALRFGVLLVAMILYIILHELTHAAVMRYYGAKKVQFGFTGLYAYAGSKDDYFDKRSYTVIALAPLVVFGVLFLALCFFVPGDFFWVAYLLEIINVSGAAGDIYVSWKFSKLPQDILVKDTGASMTVYAKNETV